MTKIRILMIVTMLFLFVIISNVSANCPYPELSVSLTPDFLNDASFQNRNVNYSEIFPPQFNCSALINDPRIDAGMTVYLDFTLSFNDISGKSLELQHDIKQCKNKEWCVNEYSKDIAKDINPESNVKCLVKYLPPVGPIGAPDGNIGPIGNICREIVVLPAWDYVEMPSFDLFIKNIRAINVIEDVPLVAEKPLVARVWPFFKSNLNMTMDKEVSLKFEYSFPENTLVYSNYSKIKPLQDFDLEDVKRKVMENPNNPDEKYMSILRNVKRGDESINYLQLPVPTDTGNVKVNAEIDYLGEYNESYNKIDIENKKEKVFEVVNSRKIKILPVHVILDERDIELVDIRSPPPPGGKLIFEYGDVRKSYAITGNANSNSAVFSNLIIKKQLEGNLEFLEKIYPLAHSDIEVLGIQTLQVPIDLNGKDIDDADYSYHSMNYQKIIRALVQKAKEQKVDYAVGFVYYKALSSPTGDIKGFAGTDSLIEYVADAGQNSALFLQGPFVQEPFTANELNNLNFNSQTLAHEMAHLNYIGAGTFSADYSDAGIISDAENGRLSANGWILNQTDGTSNDNLGGAQINVWETESGKLIKESKEYDRYEDKLFTQVFGIRAGNLILDILSRTGPVFITKEQYEKLLNNYKEKK